MDRRGFLARLGGALLVAVGLPLPAWARAVEPMGPSQPIGGLLGSSIDDLIDALPVEPRDGWPLPDTAPYVVGPRGDRTRYTLRSWRAMTHPLTATAEEKRLAKLPWTGSLDDDASDALLWDE